jgi:hypothetical protein
MISSYSVENKCADGSWKPITTVPLRSGTLCWAAESAKAFRIELDDFESAIANRNLNDRARFVSCIVRGSRGLCQGL